jgi:hypothetical protein
LSLIVQAYIVEIIFCCPGREHYVTTPTLNPESLQGLPTMASRKESKVIGWLKVPRRVFNRARRSHSPTLPETNINANDDLEVGLDQPHAILSTPHASSQCSSTLLGIDSADRVGETPAVEGNRTQGTLSFQHPTHPLNNLLPTLKPIPRKLRRLGV